MTFAQPAALSRSFKAWAGSIAPWRFLLSCGDAALPKLAQTREILVIRLDGIGDFVLTTPFLRALRHSAPQARITLVVKPEVVPLAETCPYLDEVLSFDPNRFNHRRGCRVLRRCSALLLGWRRLGRNRFDLVLLPRRGPDYYDAEFLAHLWAGPAPIIGCREPDVSFPQDIFSLAHAFKNSRLEHEVLHNLHFLEFCGAPPEKNSNLELWLSPEDLQSARDMMPEGFTYVALGTGAGHADRRWPIDCFSALASWLWARHRLKSVFIGAGTDPSCPAGISLLGRTTLRQAAAVLSLCHLFIGNDSGVKHLASAMGLPVLELGTFYPDRFSAWGVPHLVLTPLADQPAYDLNRISLEQVQEACTEFLNRLPPSVN